MSSTGEILRKAAHAITYRGLQNGPHYADTEGRLDMVGAIFYAATGKVPNSFTTDNETASLLVETSEPTMAAVRAVSAALPTDVPTDVETGRYCHIEHLIYWQTDERPPNTGANAPTPAEVIGMLLRAANTDAATTSLHIPGQRTAA